MVMARPGVFSVPNLYAKYFGISNSVEICREASFIKSTGPHHGICFATDQTYK